MRIDSPSQTDDLTGTLAHLPALAAEAPHALLLPLAAHASKDAEHEFELLVLLDAVSGQGAIHKLLITVQETDHVGRDELLVLDLGLKLRNEGGRFDLVGLLADDDLHGCSDFLLGCSNLRESGRREKILERSETKGIITPVSRFSGVIPVA